MAKIKRQRKDGYTEDQIEYLKEIALNKTNKEITRMFNEKFNLNKTITSIIGIKSRQGIYSYTRVYTEEQLDYLKSISKGKTHKEITELFNKEFKDNRTETGIKSIMFEKGILLSDDGRFKKGNRPKNTLPIGTEIMREDGYLYVKIAEPNKWKQKHRIIYEKYHGKIPAKHVVLFGDGDRMNFDIGNLILASKAQVLQLNRYELIQEDADLTKMGLVIADMHLKIGEIRNKTKGDSNVKKRCN